jgi:hypothetical protein
VGFSVNDFRLSVYAISEDRNRLIIKEKKQ